jgi:hypothetical protein
MLLVEFLAYHASFSLKPQIPLEPGLFDSVFVDGNKLASENNTLRTPCLTLHPSLLRRQMHFKLQKQVHRLNSVSLPRAGGPAAQSLNPCPKAKVTPKI